MERQADTQYILSLSYGKDSIACLEAIKQLGYPLDRVVHAEIWATDSIHADLPPMVEFKSKADEIIKERYGIEVEHVYAVKNKEILTYEKQFYTVRHNKKRSADVFYGFPCVRGQWCTSMLKTTILPSHNNAVSYLGIAADEPERIERHSAKKGIILPLVDIGWDEAYCRKWCEENKLLSPIYITAARGGCWFCHNQSVEQLRLLRKSYPDLWELLLKWDSDSPVHFKPDGHTVHDYDRRFALEDMKLLSPNDRRFRWSMLDGDLQARLY